MTRRTAFVARSLMLIACLSVTRSAEAQWYFAGYLGANTTQSAEVAIEIPASNLALEFHDVQFDAHPFESPQYTDIESAGCLVAAGGLASSSSSRT